MQPIRKMFPGGNTAKGFHSFYDFIAPLRPNRIYIIKGGPGIGKSTLIRKIGMALYEKGLPLELHLCSSDNSSLDAVALPSLKVSVVDGTSPHTVDPKWPGAVEEIINLGNLWDSSYLRHHRQPIIKLFNQISYLFMQAYRYFQAANSLLEEREDWVKSIQPDWEQSVYIEARKLGNQLLDTSLSREARDPDWPTGRHLFASAITPNGIVNTLGSLTEGIEQLIVIRGCLRSARTLVLKVLSHYSLAHGYYTEIFHCGLRPDDIEHLIIQPTGMAILSADWYLDFQPPGNSTLIEVDLDSLLKINSQRLPLEYVRAHDLMRTCIERGIELIRKAKEHHDELEQYYKDSMDFAQVKKFEEGILNDIQTIVVDEN
ncbi:MAG: hypothetical protein H5U02_03905 [Clostridia bacterium]|nr:hypothetical protein [Clostridia bacterium]